MWLAEVHGWIRQRVTPTGPIEQPHVRPWATALRVPTCGGDVWFKASIPVLAHEAGLVTVLAALRPDAVPPLLAADLERGWMLMGDGGLRLREVVEREQSLDRWLDILPRYGQLQLDVASCADELVTLGVPDRRLSLLADQYEDLLRVIEPPDGAVGAVPRVRDLCEELASYGLPETAQHDDLHDAQIFVGENDYLFFDWGDACVSHVFFSMSVTLEGQLAWGLDDVEGSEDIAPYRDAYLESFRGFAAQAELQAAHEIALRLGWICLALNWHRFASGLPAPYREEYLQGVGLRLRMMLAGFD